MPVIPTDLRQNNIQLDTNFNLKTHDLFDVGVKVQKDETDLLYICKKHSKVLQNLIIQSYESIQIIKYRGLILLNGIKEETPHVEARTICKLLCYSET